MLLRDTGILHRLLRIEDFDQLSGTPMIGHSWEAYVIEQIKCLANSSFDLYFYRTHAGAEVDLVLTKGIIPTSDDYPIHSKVRVCDLVLVSWDLSKCVNKLPFGYTATMFSL
jgi:predicted AAA+ superfamily ATPase